MKEVRLTLEFWNGHKIWTISTEEGLVGWVGYKLRTQTAQDIIDSVE